MQLALFDLDNTLLPLDSDYEWARFLVRIGVLDGASHERENDRFYQQYQAGTLNILEFLQFQLAPLAAHPLPVLQAWHAQFMEETIRPAIRPQARELVARHQQTGDLCVIVTATNEFITRPIAQAFGVEHLIATRIERSGEDGPFTGRPQGRPNYREGKVDNTTEWLAARGTSLPQFTRSWFYSDSANDLPLMSLVTDPVATNPDARLDQHARANHWPVLKLFG